VVVASCPEKTITGIDFCGPRPTPTEVCATPCSPKLCLKPCPFGDVCSPCFAITSERPVYRSILNPCAPCPPCVPEPFVNCTPNLPPKPCGGAAWKPLPPAHRGIRHTQTPQVAPTSLCCNPCPDLGLCTRECLARDLVLPRSDYKLENCTICPRECRRCHNSSPENVFTCATLGRRKLNDRVTSYYNYPGQCV